MVLVDGEQRMMSGCLNRIAASLLGMLALCATTGCRRDPQPEQRPKNVPLVAVWAGSAEGGAYFNCSSGDLANQCTIWDENTGRSRSGRFVLDGYNRGATSSELRYRGTDGTNIYLKRGLVLRPVR